MSSNKTISIELDGKPQTVEYRTSLKFGELEKLRKSVYTGKNPFTAEYDVMLYKRLLMEMAIVNAPFNPKNYTEIYELDADAISKIEDTLLEEFPLERILGFLGKMMKTSQDQDETKS